MASAACIFPQALGVGYDTIGALLQGDVSGSTILGILIVKAVIWTVALGSGTSGGVLAPLLMMGGALGGVEAWVLPNEGAGFWPLVSMGAILGGTMRSPFTGVIFALELTHDVNMLLPLLVAVTIAHGFTVLVLKRSILTEKVARRGYHLTREYAIDPLEILFAREVMRTNVAALPAEAPFGRCANRFVSIRRSVRSSSFLWLTRNAACKAWSRGSRFSSWPIGMRVDASRSASSPSCTTTRRWPMRTSRCVSSFTAWLKPA